MKRGWRNDPAWVVYYEARDKERLERQLDAKLLEQAIQEMELQKKAWAMMKKRNVELAGNILSGEH